MLLFFLIIIIIINCLLVCALHNRILFKHTVTKDLLAFGMKIVFKPLYIEEVKTRGLLLMFVLLMSLGLKYMPFCYSKN